MYCKYLLILVIACIISADGQDEYDDVESPPVSDELLTSLAADVCADLGIYYNTTNQAACTVNFLQPRVNNLGEQPSVVTVKCVSETSAVVMVSRKQHFQLVILAPENDTTTYNVPYTLMTNEDSVYQTLGFNPGNYTVWSTIVDDQGPTSWIKGAGIPKWTKPDPKEYAINITMPFSGYKNGSKTDVMFSWNATDDSDSCFAVANICNKQNLGTHFYKELGPISNNSIVISDLPLDDDCIFTVYGTRGSTDLSYATPHCEEVDGCAHLLEPVRGLYVQSERAAVGDGYDVRVGWAVPRRRPNEFNVTLIADDARSTLVDGNTTEVVFRSVIGQGLFDVVVISYTNDGKAYTSRAALFTGSARSYGVGALGAWGGAGVLAAGLLLTLLLYYFRRTRDKPQLYFPFPRDCKSPYIGGEVSRDCWEVNIDELLRHEVVGRGAFGVVWRGTLTASGRQVAVKMLKDFPSQEELRVFRAEMELMKSVVTPHPHVAGLVGCCSGWPPAILTDYCSKGDLLTYLRKSWDIMVSKRNAKYQKTKSYYKYVFKDVPEDEPSKLVNNKLYDLDGCDNLSAKDLLSFCRQIAMGMEFLASNRVVHRDLAARNVLVAEDRTLKIADFGLSRDVYQDNQYKQNSNGKMPVKWMALESLTRRTYTTQSDVWSFGVVMWEIVTVGGEPYADVPTCKLLKWLQGGRRLPKPIHCGDHLYELMLSCWQARPQDRPTFTALYRELDELLKGACADEYLSLEWDNDASQVSKIDIIFRGKLSERAYERPLKPPKITPQSNHYTTPPAIAWTQHV